MRQRVAACGQPGEKPMRHAVIMAGGAGRRLWPLSRRRRPKQLLPLIRGRNLLEIAVQRLEGLFPLENTWVITNAEYADEVVEALPQLPAGNVIGEPEGKDTANAIALGAEVLAARDEDGTMAVFTADHVIRPVQRFCEAVRTACEAVEKRPTALLTFGIRPTWPHTGLGYIHCGPDGTSGVYQVLGFKEKPDHRTARQYIDSGQYYWNSGMFVWTVRGIQQALAEFLPDSRQKLGVVRRAVREGRNYGEELKGIYPTLEKISIDYAVMEHAREVLMVELRCEWLDVGSWPALENVAETDESGNAIVAPNVATLDSCRNVIVCEDGHLVAVMGVDDCVVVHSPDATLVCNKPDALRLKELVSLIEQQHGEQYS
jgi:mannose-1-phosphate guanylyltransferase